MNRRDAESGFALTEVIVALLITGILLTIALRFFTEQWRISQVLKDRNEAHYTVMNAGQMVLYAIREGKSVEWDASKEILTVLPSNQESNSDQYFIADKDHDGINDLYRNHQGVPNPVVSGMLNWNCTKGENGLWTVTIKAKVGNQIVEWQGAIRQRVAPVMNMVLLRF